RDDGGILTAPRHDLGLADRPILALELAWLEGRLHVAVLVGLEGQQDDELGHLGNGRLAGHDVPQKSKRSVLTAAGGGSSFAPRLTMVSAPLGSGRWSAIASSQGAVSLVSTSPGSVKMTGMAL